MVIFLQSLFLFFPILAANQAAHLVQALKLPDMPTSVRLFGANKTIMPFVVAPMLAMLIFRLYRGTDWHAAGLVVGLGVVIGEHTKSFFKRRLELKEGTPWFFDRIDFAAGGGIAAWLYFYPSVSLLHVLCLIAIAYPVHLVGNRVSYALGWRKTPH